MSQANLRNTAGNPYLYLEGTSGSTAAGLNVSGGDIFNIVVTSAASDIDPTSSPASISIDPTTSGNITLRPQLSSGEVVIANGSIFIEGSGGSPGNLIMTDTTTGGGSGVIEFGGESSPFRFIHNFGTNNTFLGQNAGTFNAGIGQRNIAVGTSALTSIGSAGPTSNNNVAIGYQALTSLEGAAGNNIAIGTSALASTVSDFSNIAIGTGALEGLNGTGGALSNVAIGVDAGESITTGTLNILVGASAGISYTSSESSNIVIGNSGTVSESNHIRIGTQGAAAGQQNSCNIAGIFGNSVSSPSVVTIDSSGNMGSAAFPASGVTSSNIQNTAAGTGAGTSLLVGFASSNTAFGFDALHAGTNMSGNTAVGSNALGSSTTDSNNSAFGSGALTTLNGGSNNTAIGHNALNVSISDNNNVAVGDRSLAALNGGGNNTAIGFEAANVLTTNSNNVAVGYKALGLATGGDDNVAIGQQALAHTQDGNNIGIGGGALFSFTTSSGIGSNVAVGVNAGGSLTTGGRNCTVGSSSLELITTGSYNTAFGDQAAISFTGSESSNISIGFQSGVVGDNNTIRIGVAGSGSGQQSSCFIAGITGVGVTGTPVLVSASGQLGVAPSSARFKDNMQDMADDSSAIYNLRPVTFNYKLDQNKSKQFGLIAEEVNEVIPSMVTYDLEGRIQSVKYQDLVPMLLNEIIKLNKRINLLESK